VVTDGLHYILQSWLASVSTLNVDVEMPRDCMSGSTLLQRLHIHYGQVVIFSAQQSARFLRESGTKIGLSSVILGRLPETM
jgi:hypothetical protein